MPPPKCETVAEAFHLAWHTKQIPAAAGREVRYLLVPVDAPPLHTLFLDTRVISDSGRPLGLVNAFASQLACLRDPSTSAGQADPDEQALIAKLRERAARAGFSLPDILPTPEKPPWSRATLSKMTRLVLVRSAGVS
jgi:hypothetical protein